jgi:hypothetical protein
MNAATQYALHGIMSLSAKMLRQTNRHAFEARVLDTRDRYINQKRSREKQRVYRRSPRCSSFDQQRRRYIRTGKSSHLKIPSRNKPLTHLLQTVDDKPVGFHNWSNLCRQRAQQLTRLLLFARINHGERGNKINMGIRVRFIFVEPQVDHMYVRGRSRRVERLRSSAGEGLGGRFGGWSETAGAKQGPDSCGADRRTLFRISYLIALTQFSPSHPTIISDRNAHLRQYIT